MKKILITANHFREIAGACVVTLELAEQFLLWGWDVTIYSNLTASPMLDEAAKLPFQKRLHIPEDPYGYVEPDFNVIWIQHNTLPQSVIEALGTNGIKANIIWHHMSGFVTIELPMYAELENELSDVVTCISPEISDEIQKYGIRKEKIQIFDNPAPDYFINYNVGMGKKSNLTSILLVSNHLPQEIDEAAAILALRGIRVEKLGEGNRVVRLTPEILARNDAVVTIGKTVQYALPLGIPVYEYDRFGGTGWLKEDNFEKEAYTNFSGRATRLQKSAEQIAEEIISGYPSAVDFAKNNAARFGEKYRLSRQLDEILQIALKNTAVKRLKPAAAAQFNNFNSYNRGYYRMTEDYKEENRNLKMRAGNQMSDTGELRDELNRSVTTINRALSQHIEFSKQLSEHTAGLNEYVHSTCDQLNSRIQAIERHESNSDQKIEALNQQILQMHASRFFRIGEAVTWAPRKINSFFKSNKNMLFMRAWF